MVRARRGANEARPFQRALLDANDPTLFPKLTEAQVQLLARRGEVRPTTVGEVLFRQGDAAYDVLVVLEGSVSVLVGSGEEERELLSTSRSGRRSAPGRGRVRF